MENIKYKKVCLNCKGNWEECEGYKCVCLEGVCCDSSLTQEQKEAIAKYSAFGFYLVKG